MKLTLLIAFLMCYITSCEWWKERVVISEYRKGLRAMKDKNSKMLREVGERMLMRSRNLNVDKKRKYEIASYYFLGIAEHLDKNMNKAKEYFKTGLDICLNWRRCIERMKSAIGQNLFALGYIAMDEGNYSDAITFFRESFENYSSKDCCSDKDFCKTELTYLNYCIHGMHLSSHKLADAYYKVGEIVESKRYYRKSIESLIQFIEEMEKKNLKEKIPPYIDDAKKLIEEYQNKFPKDDIEEYLKWSNR